MSAALAIIDDRTQEPCPPRPAPSRDRARPYLASRRHADGRVTTYDNENRPLTTQKAGVPLLRVEYDELGRKKFETDANHNVNTFIYDDGRSLLLLESRPLAAITQHQYDAMGDRIESRDPEGRVSTSTFDLRRRLLTATNGENEITTYTYDGNGNRLTLRRPLGNTWTSVYDNANRLTTLTDPLTGATRFTYDNNGNRLTQTDANNRTTTYAYDALNRQSAMIYPDNARAEFRYDENGNRTGLTDPQGQIFSTAFDALNRETQKHYPLPAAPTGDDLQAIATQYDPNGNPARITETYTGVTGNRVTTKSFDAFDRLTAVTDAFGKTLTYQFDANGNRTVLTDPDGKVTRYGFDALNRVIAVTNAGGVTNYDYDRSSLQTKVSYPNGTNATQTHDRARRVLTIGNRQGTATVSSYAYGYDANGNRTQQVETNGPTPETTAYTYDTTDRLTQVAYPDKTTTYTYDAAYNRLTERTVNAAAVTETDKTYAYNNRNQLTGITDNLNSANSVVYTFDVNGNQTQKTKSGVSTTFAYDVKDQLLTVRENTTTLGVFSYDYQGLRVVKDMGGSTVRYTYDDKSVLLQTDINGQTIAKYDYGTNRLLSLSHVTEGRQFYLFDALGSVSNLTTPAGAIQARYQYDAFGNQRAQAGRS
jgi:YD repeat-containing protein